MNQEKSTFIIRNPWIYIGTLRVQDIHFLSSMILGANKRASDRTQKRMPFKFMVEGFFDIAEKHYYITKEQLRNRKRDQDLVYVRQLFCYWMHTYYGELISWRELGRQLGQIEHTSSIANYKAFNNRLLKDAVLPKRLNKPGITTRVDFTIINDKIYSLCS